MNSSATFVTTLPEYTRTESTESAINTHVQYLYDRLCGLVVRVLGYRSGGPGSITVTTRKKEKKKEWV
jgi:hypothetical protein